MTETRRLPTGVDPDQETCELCEQLWEVKFEWDYTDPERYCRGHLLSPLEGQPGKTLLDYMPECQRITHRILADQGNREHAVRIGSTAMLQTILTGQLRQVGAQ